MPRGAISYNEGGLFGLLLNELNKGSNMGALAFQPPPEPPMAGWTGPLADDYRAQVLEDQKRSALQPLMDNAADALGPMGMLGHTVYHGSPHRFDKFDASKIGTGEGAQAYGHGLYFAESPGVARSYRDDLGASVSVDGQPWIRNGQSVNPDIWDKIPDPDVRDALLAANGDVDAAVRRSRQIATDYRARGYGEADFWDGVADRTEKYRDRVKVENTGSLYTVDLADKAIPRMLDWDKPLSSAPPAFRDLVMNLPRYQDPSIVARTKIGEAYGELAGAMGGRHVVSETLRKAGIPGIRYLDGSSRASGQGTSNFVVFPGNEHLLNILGVE